MASAEAIGGDCIRERRHGFDAYLTAAIALAIRQPIFSAASTIVRQKPCSLAELAELSGRNKSNLSRTLKTMSRYGLVELKERERGTLAPRVPFDRVRLDVSLTQPPRRVA